MAKKKAARRSAASKKSVNVAASNRARGYIPKKGPIKYYNARTGKRMTKKEIINPRTGKIRGGVTTYSNDGKRKATTVADAG